MAVDEVGNDGRGADPAEGMQVSSCSSKGRESEVCYARLANVDERVHCSREAVSELRENRKDRESGTHS